MKPAPKRPDARARLLRFVGADGSQDYMGAAARRHKRTVLRLLRAHERELAERAGLAAYESARVAFAENCPVYKPDGAAATGISTRTSVSAAILGPPRPAGRGKKGA